MNKLDKQIRFQQQMLVASQAARIMELERELEEAQVRLKVANEQIAEHVRGNAKKVEAQA